VSNIVDRLGLYYEGLNPCKKITTSVVVPEGFTFVFGTKLQNGWKVSVSEFLIEEDCETFCKLYEDVYAHPPRNGDYPAIFLRDWLAKCKGVQVNSFVYQPPPTMS
jgi:hypothetical protein